jgi:hypothetical protein
MSRLKIKGWKKVYYEFLNKHDYINISQSKLQTKNYQGHYIMIKVSRINLIRRHNDPKRL